MRRVDSVIVALASGVAAGALITGVVEQAAAFHARRTDARVAARLVYGDLHEAIALIGLIRRKRNLEDRRLLPRFLKGWEKHQAAFARAASSKDFHTVNGAFVGLGRLGMYDPSLPYDDELDSDVLEDLRLCQQAREIAWNAGEGWIDRRLAKRRNAQLVGIRKRAEARVAEHLAEVPAMSDQLDLAEQVVPDEESENDGR